MDNYEILEEIGIGSYGRVNKVKHINTGEILCLKRMKRKNLQVYLREISNLQRCHHPNIITIKDIFINEKYLCYVMPYMKENLYNHIHTYGISEEKILYYSKCLISALSHLHEMKIYHRDIKSSNILINNGEIYLCDFGMSKLVNVNDNTVQVQSLWSKCPEILLGDNKYDEKIDIWSIGCVIAEMINGNHIFKGNSEIDQLIKIYTILGGINTTDWSDCCNLPGYNPRYYNIQGKGLNSTLKTNNETLISLCSSLLSLNPKNRKSAKECLTLYFPEHINDNITSIIKNYIHTCNYEDKILLMEWIFDICHCYNITNNIIVLNAIFIIHKYLSLKSVNINQYKLVCIVCIYLSDVLHSLYHGVVEDYMIDNCYDRDDFNVIMDDIIRTIGYNVDLVNILHLPLDMKDMISVFPFIYYMIIYTNLDWNSIIDNITMLDNVDVIKSFLSHNYNNYILSNTDIADVKEFVSRLNNIIH
ncbi:serine-threonine kinase [Orpheovirus IHUMI-LCC2]|uniref:Cell division control protein 2 related kinase n=1 Tax=Orpheovirus IHUMI-LCC2 TaxID=2023057 RepID=A0A2I2L4H4_9VIRU|nr:serine-threonine kinase [Orpheovirus IHUMI-LCC2]SNW62411.1 Cell division control protein 2 related kinase [Orpheovirus IHUMI-LCC2]